MHCVSELPLHVSQVAWQASQLESIGKVILSTVVLKKGQVFGVTRAKYSMIVYKFRRGDRYLGRDRANYSVRINEKVLDGISG